MAIYLGDDGRLDEYKGLDLSLPLLPQFENFLINGESRIVVDGERQMMIRAFSDLPPDTSAEVSRRLSELKWPAEYGNDHAWSELRTPQRIAFLPFRDIPEWNLLRNHPGEQWWTQATTIERIACQDNVDVVPGVVWRQFNTSRQQRRYLQLSARDRQTVLRGNATLFTFLLGSVDQAEDVPLGRFFRDERFDDKLIGIIQALI